MEQCVSSHLQFKITIGRKLIRACNIASVRFARRRIASMWTWNPLRADSAILTERSLEEDNRGLLREDLSDFLLDLPKVGLLICRQVGASLHQADGFIEHLTRFLRVTTALGDSGEEKRAHGI